MLVYDVSSRDSFEALDSWVEEIKKDIGSAADFERVVFTLCANKVPLIFIDQYSIFTASEML